MKFRDSLGLMLLAGAVTVAVMACAGPDPGHATFSAKGADQLSGDGNSAAAAGATDPSGGASGPVNAVFKTKVFPLLDVTCGGSQCHLSGSQSAPIWMDVDADTTYPILMKITSPAAILAKGAHAGPALTAEEKAAVTEWAASEGGGGAADGG